VLFRSMALTPVALKFGPAVSLWICRFLPRNLVRGKGGLVQSGHKIRMSDHVVIVGFGLNGKNLAKVLKAYNIPYAVVEANPYTISSERKRGARIVFGDATSPEVLEHVQIAKARIMVIAISDAAASRRVAALARKIHPGLHIVVRTRYLAEMEPLYELGANDVIPEEFETSIEIFTRVLKRYLIPNDQIEECVATVRQDSYEMFRTLSKINSPAAEISSFLSGAEIGTFTVASGSMLAGESLGAGTLRNRSGATLLAIRRGVDVIPNPDPVWELQEEDVVLLIGTPPQLAMAGKLFLPAMS